MSPPKSLLLAVGALALGLAACASAAPAAKPPSAKAEDPIAGRADAGVARVMARIERNIPGLAVVAVRGDQIAYLRGFGVADLATGAPATAQTAFYIASSTKPFTALAASILEAEGALDLDQSLAAALPDLAFNKAIEADKITLRDLLSHASGADAEGLSFRLAYSGDHDRAARMALIAASQPNPKAPRGTFSYTNYGYYVVSEIIEAKTGKPWQDAIAEKVFAPLGMTHSVARASDAAKRAVALAGLHGGAERGAVERLPLEKTDATMHAAGGLFISAEDAGRLLIAQLNDGRLDAKQVLPAGVVASTQRGVVEVGAKSGPYERDAYGLGWHVGRWRGEPFLHHFGSYAGARAHMSFMPDRRMAVAVLVNESPMGELLADPLANYFYDLMAGAATADADLDAAVEAALAQRDRFRQAVAADRAKRANRAWTLTKPLPAYVGEYASPTHGAMAITEEGGRLRARIGALAAAAEPFTAPDSIRVELIPARGEVIAFELDETGRAQALTYDGARFSRR